MPAKSRILAAAPECVKRQDRYDRLVERVSVSSLLLIFALAVNAGAAVTPEATLRFLLSKQLAEEGRFGEALVELERTIEASPEDPYLRLERAAILFQQGRLDRASADVAHARSLAPEDLDVLRLQGRIELARSEARPEAASIAREALEELRVKRPSDLEVLLSLGQLYLSAGQAALAVETLEEAPVEQQARLDYRQRLARQLLFAGAPVRARLLASGVVAERPAQPNAQILLARIELVLGYFRKALEALEPVRRMARSHGVVTELMARAFEGLGQFAAAAEVIEARRQHAADSDDAQAFNGLTLELAGLWSRAGRWDRAAELAFEAGESGEASIAEAGLRLGARALVRGGRVDEALERVRDSIGGSGAQRHLREALLVDLLLTAGRQEEAEAQAESLLATGSESSLAVAAAFQEHGQYARALPLLEKAVEKSPKSLEAGFRLASCLERLGRRDEAVARFRRLIEHASRFTPALNYLGYLWIERGENLGEAMRLVREAVRIEPDNGAYVDSLGWGEYQQGRYPQAVELLERAARLLPDDATVLEHLGDARAADGDLPGATAAYRRALELATESSAELRRKLELVSGED
jgi:tetratricopeptide (TPR) repeat protein